MLYVKAMKQDGTYQILEVDGYLEFVKTGESVQLVYNYLDSDREFKEGRTWLEGDCFIMNESGVTVSSFPYKKK